VNKNYLKYPGLRAKRWIWCEVALSIVKARLINFFTFFINGGGPPE